MKINISGGITKQTSIKSILEHALTRPMNQQERANWLDGLAVRCFQVLGRHADGIYLKRIAEAVARGIDISRVEVIWNSDRKKVTVS